MKRKFIMYMFVMVMSLTYVGCSKPEPKSESEDKQVVIGSWEPKEPDLVTSFEELNTKSIEYLKSLENKYIRVSYKIGSISIDEGLYFKVSVDSNEMPYNSQERYKFRIFGTLYQNYWEIPYKVGDIIIVEGYLYQCYTYIIDSEWGNSAVSLYINPCIVSKDK